MQETIEQMIIRTWKTDPGLQAEFMGDIAAYEAHCRLEEKVKREWKASPELRAEFGGDILRYAAYCKAVAEGRVRIQGQN